MPFRLSIRTKLLLVTLVLFLIPFVGFGYVREMESFLRVGQEQSVIATARAAATALHDRPALLEFRSTPARIETHEPIGPGAAPSTIGTTVETAIPRPASAGDAEPISSGVPSSAALREVELIIRGLGRAQSRIWVIDQRRNLLVLTGSLKRDREGADVLPATSSGFWGGIESNVLRPLYALLLRPPSEDFDDALPEAELSAGREVDSALSGVPASRWRNTTDGRAVVLSAAHPIWSGEEVIGAVVVEETTNAVASLRYRAIEQLLSVTLAVFVLGAGSMFLFASRLSSRLRRLRDDAENAVDAQGRVAIDSHDRADGGKTSRAKRLAQSAAADEIGDLSRSFSTMLERLAQYNAYLERMADRLSHELRTPVAVVSSSLDNLKLQALPGDATTYIGRAEEGIKRLNLVLTRMREATRLERMLHEVERERFDLTRVVAGCVAGYGGAFADRRFQLTLPSSPVWLDGSPELVAQLLDKIVDNAIDFSPAGEPIDIHVTERDGRWVLAVSNVGPSLPATMQGQLFESMISVREGANAVHAGKGIGGPHLGLGLFMVRLIAEFHGATAEARNRDDGRGVTVEVAFSRASD